jgi:transcription initiation factor IIF auxiliary subunit
MRPIEYELEVERVPGVPLKVFKENGRKNFYVRLFIQSENPSDLDQIDFVIYELHPTFRKPKRMSKDRSNGFDLKIWTWGFFPISAQIFLKNGDVRSVTGYVKYKV